MNMNANSCPCCDSSLLRHVRHGKIYWFCQSCWQEVPLLTVSNLSNLVKARNSSVITPETVKS
ncbi:MAG: hypothetical protein QNJ47_09210 [Nostocaceae cyanobacterium]|nr:hypothetical protein [Nostocaceae cyanobacterium]